MDASLKRLRSFKTASSRLRISASRRSYSFRMSSPFFLVSSRSPSKTCFFLEISFNWLWMCSASNRNWLASQTFSSSFNCRYSLAAFDWRSKGSTCFSSSFKISDTRTRLACSSSSFFCAMALRRLYFTIPAASSKSSRRSSGFPLKILSICPCPIME